MKKIVWGGASMIERLRVRNFRALRDEQTLELVATTDRMLLAENTCKTASNAVPRLLRSAILFGGNGWGKSTALDVLRAARKLVLGEPVHIAPFLLDRDSRNDPTEIELAFFAGRTRCILKVAILAGAIVHEEFSIYTTQRPTLLYCRNVREGGQTWEFGARLKGFKAAALRRVDEKTLFLARYLERGMHLQEVRAFFENLTFKSDMELAHIPRGFWDELAKDRKLAGRVTAFLGEVGTGIEDMILKESSKEGDGEVDAPLFRHSGMADDTGGLLPFADESSGI